MKKLTIVFPPKILNIFKWVFIIIVSLFIVLVIIRFISYFNKEKINKQIIDIHSIKLNIGDVTGDNLPSDPGVMSDNTLVGIDSNKNNIRDDVEIAIFKEYSNSAKTRAVLLQYAMTLQREVSQISDNTSISTELFREEDRANACLSDTLVPRKNPESPREYSDIEKIDSYLKFVDDRQFNTQERKTSRNVLLKNVRSFSDLDGSCDIDLSKLSN